MPAFARILLLTVAIPLALASIALAAAETALPKNSPFVPTTATHTASPSTPENYELAAISTIGAKTTVSIYDKAAKKGRWIAVGETSEGIKVVSFDPRREQVVVRIQNGPEKTLSLRSSSSAPVVIAPVTMPAPPPITTISLKPASEPAVIASAPTSPANTPPPPAPGTPAYQEQEARMLVSDLLEIGMAQRKAYEEAQRKAAEAAQNPPPPARVPPPTNAAPAPKTPAKQ